MLYILKIGTKAELSYFHIGSPFPPRYASLRITIIRRVVIIFILSDVSAVATTSTVFLRHPGSLHLQLFVDYENQRHVEELRVFVHQLPGICHVASKSFFGALKQANCRCSNLPKTKVYVHLNPN